MKICPTCQRCYEDMTSICSEDHTALATERPGTCLLVGTYRLECLLGRGDKGTAYEARDLDLDAPVIAVELNGTKVIDDPQEMKSFHREARRVVRAGGQDVADIYDYGPLPNGGAYVVMERIERDLQREDLLIKSPPIASPATADSVAPSSDHGRLSVEPSRVQSEATTVESTEDETLTSPHHAQAAGDAMARLTEEETITFAGPQIFPPRVVRDDIVRDDAAAAIRPATISRGPNLASPAPPPVATPTPSNNPDRSAQLSPPIVVKVPDEGSGRKRHRQRPLVYVGLAALVVAAIIALWLAFNRDRAPSPNPPVASVTSPTAEASPLLSPPITNSPATEPMTPAATEPAFPASAIADNPPPVMSPGRRAPNARAQTPRVILDQTLNDWITATARRNIEWQMSFYMPVLTTFYSQSDVPQDFVREEKARLYGDAQTLDVRLLGKPQITFSEGGRVATMRFRLSSVTDGGGRNRPGEVRRELRWRKTDEGWKIFSERGL